MTFVIHRYRVFDSRGRLQGVWLGPQALARCPTPSPRSLFPRCGLGNCLSSGVPQVDFAVPEPSCPGGPGLPRSSRRPALPRPLPLASRAASPSLPRPFDCTSAPWLCPPAAVPSPDRPAWRGRPARHGRAPLQTEGFQSQPDAGAAWRSPIASLIRCFHRPGQLLDLCPFHQASPLRPAWRQTGDLALDFTEQIEALSR